MTSKSSVVFYGASKKKKKRKRKKRKERKEKMKEKRKEKRKENKDSTIVQIQKLVRVFQ